MGWRKGAKNPGAKLTEDQVRQVRAWAARGMPYSQIVRALEGKITKAAVSLIVNRRVWKDID